MSPRAYSHLCFAPGPHQARACYDKRYAHRRRYSLVMFGRHSKVRIAQAYAVMLGMRHGYEEGNDSQHENYNANHEQGFHECLQS
jgi:hypothetical protein